MLEESGDSLAALQSMEQRVDAIQKNLGRLLEASQCPGFWNSGSQSSITQNIGSVPVWIAVMLCFSMLTATLSSVAVASAWAIHEFGKRDAQIRELQHVDRDQQDYLNAIYRQAPQLKGAKN